MSDTIKVWSSIAIPYLMSSRMEDSHTHAIFEEAFHYEGEVPCN